MDRPTAHRRTDRQTHPARSPEAAPRCGKGPLPTQVGTLRPGGAAGWGRTRVPTGAQRTGRRGCGGSNRLQLKTKQTGPQKSLKGTAPSRTNQKLWPGVHALHDEALPRLRPRLRPPSLVCGSRSPTAPQLRAHRTALCGPRVHNIVLKCVCGILKHRTQRSKVKTCCCHSPDS